MNCYNGGYMNCYNGCYMSCCNGCYMNNYTKTLIQQYTEKEYLSDEEAEYCNQMIENLEKESYTNTYKVNTEDLDKKLDELESKGNMK